MTNLEAIRARCAKSVSEIVDNPREYFKVQQILRDRAELLAEVDRLQAESAIWDKLSLVQLSQENERLTGELEAYKETTEEAIKELGKLRAAHEPISPLTGAVTWDMPKDQVQPLWHAPKSAGSL